MNTRTKELSDLIRYLLMDEISPTEITQNNSIEYVLRNEILTGIECLEIIGRLKGDYIKVCQKLKILNDKVEEIRRKYLEGKQDNHLESLDKLDELYELAHTKLKMISAEVKGLRSDLPNIIRQILDNDF